MNNSPHELLDDLLKGDSARYREESLSFTLAAVRRRRTVRRFQKSFLAILTLAAFLFFRSGTDDQVITQATETTASPLIVQTRSLRPEQLITSRPGSTRIVESSHGRTIVVRTTPGTRLFEEISDQQLLALLDGREAAVFRSQEIGTRLIVFNESFWNGLPVN